MAKRIPMMWGNRLPIILIILMLLGCASHVHSLSAAQKAELLATQRGRLSELTDPIERVQSYITISDILLDFASGFEHDGNLDAMSGLLSQYRRAIQDANDTLVKSDRDAARNPAGFKDLEFTLASQIPRLRDLGPNLTSEERQPIETALRIATSVREGMLKLLSPSAPGTARQ